MDNQLEKIAQDIYHVAVLAGEAILPYYHRIKEIQVQYKADDSPLTAADEAAHDVIAQHLEHYVVFDKAIPVLSEEGGTYALAEKFSWQHYWCVDPLDGTKEFVNGHSEFTVNIALIEQHQPILGVIYSPVLKTGYVAWKGGGAYRRESNTITQIHTAQPVHQPLQVIASRRHGIEQIDRVLSQLPEHHRVYRGSALKFCEIAQGTADIFLRTTLTCEWDNAAGQCIVEEAGGSLFHFDLSPVRYNTSLSLKTNPMVVVGDPSYAWRNLFQQEK